MFNALLNPLSNNGCMAYTQQTTFASAWIVLRTNLLESSSIELPLGAFGEVNFKHLRGFGVAARSSFTSAEEKLLSPLLSKVLANPHEFLRTRLRSVFDRMENEPDLRGNLIEEISSSNSSITIRSIVHHTINDAWLSGEFLDIKNDVSSVLEQTVEKRSDELRNSVSAFISGDIDLTKVATEYEGSLKFG